MYTVRVRFVVLPINGRFSIHISKSESDPLIALILIARPVPGQSVRSSFLPPCTCTHTRTHIHIHINTQVHTLLHKVKVARILFVTIARGEVVIMTNRGVFSNRPLRRVSSISDVRFGESNSDLPVQRKVNKRLGTATVLGMRMYLETETC
jgi:hypothetical protein